MAVDTPSYPTLKKKTKYRHSIDVIRFWNRLVNMDYHRLTKHIFQSNALFYVTGRRNWSYDVD